jgi:hypothetical protein
MSYFNEKGQNVGIVVPILVPVLWPAKHLFNAGVMTMMTSCCPQWRCGLHQMIPVPTCLLKAHQHRSRRVVVEILVVLVPVVVGPVMTALASQVRAMIAEAVRMTTALQATIVAVALQAATAEAAVAVATNPMITFPIVLAYLIWTSTISTILPPYQYGVEQHQEETK